MNGVIINKLKTKYNYTQELNEKLTRMHLKVGTVQQA
jgi:hypothetical protein